MYTGEQLTLKTLKKRPWAPQSRSKPLLTSPKKGLEEFAAAKNICVERKRPTAIELSLRQWRCHQKLRETKQLKDNILVQFCYLQNKVFFLNNPEVSR